MNHAELTSALAGISGHIHIKKLDIKSQQQRLAFALEYAVNQDLPPDCSRADSAKIALADHYIQMNALQYQLGVLVEKQKNIKKSLARLAA